MKKLIIFGSVTVALFVVLIVVVQLQNKEASEDNPYGKESLHPATIEQLDDPLYQNQILPEELEEMLDQKEDVTVYFYSPTCPHCQRTTPILVPLAEEYGIDLKKLNVLEFESAWDDYNINGTPTLIYFENGKEKTRIEGENTEEVFRMFFEQEVLN
ncbi:MAG: thioredoxin family protein [Bacillaceae bacterium]|nr:thioredoxin family protein [Bacillaceae bacterium]